MGDQPISKLTASLDELSLKKQLPLRQQVLTTNKFQLLLKKSQSHNVVKS